MCYMKKLLKVLSVLVAPIVFVCTFLAGCKGTEVNIDNGEIMQDIDAAPKRKAAYEEYSKRALAEYKAVAEAHKNAYGEVDRENPEVKKAARAAAAKLYAYACYNERTLDKYVWFSCQNGNTDLGAMGAADAEIQEYYLRVNESADTCGYRYHYTIKKVRNSSGLVGSFKGAFESAVIRLTDQTDLYYRFEGDMKSVNFAEDTHSKLGVNMLQCADWSTVNNKWGIRDVVMRKQSFIEPDKIEEDIVANAGQDNITIRGNINVLADNIVKNAIIAEDEEDCTVVFMFLDTDVANNDAASQAMLKKANGDNNTKWVATESDEMGKVSPAVVFRLWNNGLFRMCSIIEKWEGKINGFDGIADKSTSFYFSYSDRDCDMTKNLEMLEKAKEQKG